MSVRYAAHLRMGNTTDGNYAMICTHCGDLQVLRAPIAVDTLIAICNEFAVEHEGCACPAAGPLDAESLLQRADSLTVLFR